MAIERTNPSELAPPVMGLYAHVVVTDSPLAFIAGQVALDSSGALIGAGDYSAQARQAFTNLRDACVGAGARPADIVQMSIYVVGHSPGLIMPIFDAGKSVFGEDWPLCASKLIGVATLGMPDWLIEVDAIAAITS